MEQLALFAVETPASCVSFAPFRLIAGGEVLHVGPVERIGKHDWCYLIYHDEIWDRPTGLYAWRRPSEFPPGDDEWRRDRDWPTYDSNHYSHGCPLSLRVLWQREAAARLAFGVDDGSIGT